LFVVRILSGFTFSFDVIAHNRKGSRKKRAKMHTRGTRLAGRSAGGRSGYLPQLGEQVAVHGVPAGVAPAGIAARRCRVPSTAGQVEHQHFGLVGRGQGQQGFLARRPISRREGSIIEGESAAQAGIQGRGGGGISSVHSDDDLDRREGCNKQSNSLYEKRLE